MKRQVSIRVFAACACICVSVLVVLGIRWYANRFDASVMREKMARKAYAEIVSKRWDASAARGTGRGIIQFRIYQFDFTEHSTNNPVEIDAQTAQRLLRTEQRVGVRTRDIGRSLYDEIEVGDAVTLNYRLAGQDTIEVINVEGVYMTRRTEYSVPR